MKPGFRCHKKKLTVVNISEKPVIKIVLIEYENDCG
jgi:hypothetical protein